MLIDLNKATELIHAGKLLHIAADEKLLAQLPSGNWIGGTTPYFIAENGGVTTDELLFVTELKPAKSFKAKAYDAESIHNVAADAYDNGFTILIIPFGSKVLETFAKDAPEIDQIFLKNVAGWVSGFHLATNGAAKAFDGTCGVSFADRAVALHVELPQGKLASIGIVNLFEPDSAGPVIEFADSSFEAVTCLVDGKETAFADYIAANGIDTKLPLVANYNGANVNISIKAIEEGTVHFYAPVFSGTQYRFARPIGDYAAEFGRTISGYVENAPVFSCNCILNYLYGALEGKGTKPFSGPVTFGEVAYQLLNQTLVYITVQ